MNKSGTFFCCRCLARRVSAFIVLGVYGGLGREKMKFIAFAKKKEREKVTFSSRLSHKWINAHVVVMGDEKSERVTGRRDRIYGWQLKLN